MAGSSSLDSMNAGLIDAQNAAVSAGANQYGADKSLEGTKYSADLQYKLGLKNADTQYKGIVYGADKDFESQKYGSDNSLAGQKYTSDAGLAGQKYVSDTNLQGTREGYQNQKDLQSQKIDFANKRFNDVMSQANALYGGASSQVPDFARGSEISTAPIYGERDIQGSINAQVAQNDSRTAGQNRTAREQASSRGLAQGSPLLQRLEAYNNAQGLAANNDAARQTRQDMTGQNASHVLDAQKASNDAALGYGGLSLQGQQNQIQSKNAILALMASLGNVGI